MPDRVIRADLLTSEAWLALKNNDDRVCWLVLFLNADTFGNQPAGPHRLVHIWRHAGVDTTEKAAKVLLELTDVDLARTYEADGKRYVHIPRFGQSRRWLGRLNPLSPWTSDKEKQRLTEKAQADRSGPQAPAGGPQHGVGVGVGVGVGEIQKQGLPLAYSKAPGDNSAKATPAEISANPKPENRTGDQVALLAKAIGLGIAPRPNENFADFESRFHREKPAGA